MRGTPRASRSLRGWCETGAQADGRLPAESRNGRPDLVQRTGLRQQALHAFLDRCHQVLGEAVTQRLDDVVKERGGDHVHHNQLIINARCQRLVNIFLQARAVEQAGRLVDEATESQADNALHDQRGETLEHLRLVLAHRLTRLGVDHAQAAQGKAVVGDQRSTCVIADVGMAGHQAVVHEPLIQRRIGDLEQRVGEDCVGAERHVARCLPRTETHSGAEPLAMFINDRDQGNGRLEKIGGHRDDLVEHLVGGVFKHAQLPNTQQTLRFIQWNGGTGVHKDSRWVYGDASLTSLSSL